LTPKIGVWSRRRSSHFVSGYNHPQSTYHNEPSARPLQRQRELEDRPQNIAWESKRKEGVLRERENTVAHGKPTSGLFSTSEKKTKPDKKKRFTRREIDELAMTNEVLEFRACISFAFRLSARTKKITRFWRAFIEGVRPSYRGVGRPEAGDGSGGCDWLLLKSTNQVLCLHLGIECTHGFCYVHFMLCPLQKSPVPGIVEKISVVAVATYART